MVLHWRLWLGLFVGLIAWPAAGFLGAPAPEQPLIAWNLGALVYIGFAGRLFVGSSEQDVRARAAMQDETRGAILVLAVVAVAAAMAAIVAALISASTPPHTAQVQVAALAGVTLITSWMVLQALFAAHYAHRHFQSVAEHGEKAGFIFPGDPPRSYMDFVYLAVCIGATAQISDPNVTTTRLRNLVTAHAAISFFYNTAVLAVGINILSGLVGR